MATDHVKARRKAVAVNALFLSKSRIANLLGLEVSEPVLTNKDAELAQIQRIEDVADFLGKVDAGLTSLYQALQETGAEAQREGEAKIAALRRASVAEAALAAGGPDPEKVAALERVAELEGELLALRTKVAMATGVSCANYSQAELELGRLEQGRPQVIVADGAAEPALDADPFAEEFAAVPPADAVELTAGDSTSPQPSPNLGEGATLEASSETDMSAVTEEGLAEPEKRGPGRPRKVADGGTGEVQASPAAEQAPSP